MITAKNISISNSSGYTTLKSTLNASLPEDVNIGGISLGEFIDKRVAESVNKITLENLDKIVTQLPTDNSLSDSSVLVIKAEVGDMPKEDVGRYLSHIKNSFSQYGLTKVIIYPVCHGVGELNFDRIDIEDKYVE